MKTEFLNHFYKDLKAIKNENIRIDIFNSIKQVELAESIKEIKNIKKLKGSKIAYRIRIGDYRIGVYIENNIIEFARISHRKDIYNLFP